MDEYAYLDATARVDGHRAGKNDRWIAATAVVCGAPLPTPDPDFDAFTSFGLSRGRADPVLTP